MTVTYKREIFTTTSGATIFIEQYADKPHFVKFWRYGVNGKIYADMLVARPNKKRLIERY